MDKEELPPASVEKRYSYASWPPSPKDLDGEELQGQPPNDIRAFGTQNVLLVLLLAIVTLGLYYPIWLMQKSRTYNQLTPDFKIPLALAWTLLGLDIINYAWAIYVHIIAAAGNPSAHDIATVNQVYSIAVSVYQLVLNFQVKGAIDSVIARTSSWQSRLSGIATFFLGVLYLQYALNRRIDQINARQQAM